MAERERLNTPRGSEHRRLLPKVSVDSDTFGRFAEWVARFMGTARFLLWMTVFVVAWVTLNVVSVWHYKWDPYPFILLNLFFSTQASYSAPLILLAQNRQEARDKLALDEDRRVAAQGRADTDFLAREIASIRMNMGEMATRDYIRSELRSSLRELLAELEREDEPAEGGRRDTWLRDARKEKDRKDKQGKDKAKGKDKQARETAPPR